MGDEGADGHVCMVCLEGGADTAPPCGGSEAPAFHARCLYLAECARRRHPFLCPHCNVEVGRGGGATGALMWGVRDRALQALSAWLDVRGCWISAAVYVIARKHALVRGEDELQMDRALDDEVFSALLGGGCRVMQFVRDGGRRVYRGVSCADESEETAVFAWRTAHVGDDGRILCDGYTLRAKRYRRTPRLMREPRHIMSAR